MTSSIEDIWDEPIDAPSPHKQSVSLENDSDGESNPRSSRSGQKLFLSDSGSDNEHTANRDTQSRRVHHAPPKENIDVDALFEEDEDDPFVFKPLGPSIDVNEIQRKAEERHRKSLPSTLIPIHPSSSPPRDTNDRDDANPNKKKDGEKDGKKERRRPMRLDENRLLGPQGFPQLIKQTKNFKVKGKGHEATDLNRLLQVYQFWTHSLYPKTQFHDTVQRVEKLCHTKRMHVALSVWRDEAHGKIHVSENDDNDGVIDLTEKDRPQDINPEDRAPSRASIVDSDAVAYASSSPPATRPPTSASEFDDDDFDIDAIIQAEQDLLAKQRSSNPPAPIEQPQTSARDEDEEMWNLFNDPPSAPSAPPPRNSEPIPQSNANVMVDDDEEMWDVINEIENETGKAAAATQPSVQDTSITDYDPDMEDMYI